MPNTERDKPDVARDDVLTHWQLALGGEAGHGRRWHCDEHLQQNEMVAMEDHRSGREDGFRGCRRTRRLEMTRSRDRAAPAMAPVVRLDWA